MIKVRAHQGLTAALLAGLLSATGCVHYTLNPEHPASVPQAGSPPLPLRVGLVLDDQRAALAIGNTPQDVAASQRMLEGKGYAFGPKFAQALRQSGLFQDVVYPMRMTRDALDDVDMVISAQFGYRFNQDPLQAPKIMLVVFTGLITGAVMTETSHHLAQGVLSVEGASGRKIRSYDETMDVTAESMVSLFAELKTMEAGPPAAADGLISKLVQRLVDDRALFAAPRHKAKPAREVAEDEPEDSSGPAPAAVSAETSEPEPDAPAASAPEAPAEVKPQAIRITSAEAEAELLP